MLSDSWMARWKGFGSTSWRSRGTIAWEWKTINLLRVTGDPADVLAIRLRKWTKSVPYSYDDVRTTNNYNNKTSNDSINWNHLEIIQKYLSNICRKLDIMELQKRAILGTAHVYREVLLWKQKMFVVWHNISYTTFCNRRIAAKSYFRSIILMPYIHIYIYKNK